MAIRSVLKMGDASLLEKSRPITSFATPELRALLTDMHDTMRALDGVGIAAPQIGERVQVVLFGMQKSARYPDAEPIPLTVLINPTITPITDETEDGWEGCLCVPGMRGLVPRYTHVRYRGFDENGDVIDRSVDGFHARVVQHEVDHLNGILYPMRIVDMRKFGFTETLFPGQDVAPD